MMRLLDGSPGNNLLAPPCRRRCCRGSGIGSGQLANEELRKRVPTRASLSNNDQVLTDKLNGNLANNSRTGLLIVDLPRV
jgi:hypothetical protein